MCSKLEQKAFLKWETRYHGRISIMWASDSQVFRVCEREREDKKNTGLI